MALTEWLRRELFSGWSRFEAGWLLFFLLIQMVVFFIQPDSIAATIAAVSGVLCVVFVGKGKISNYFFGLISVSLYAYVSYTYKLYGEMMLNLLVYVPVQFIGFYMWRRHMTRENTVNPTKLKKWWPNRSASRNGCGWWRRLLSARWPKPSCSSRSAAPCPRLMAPQW